ncbi:MAG: GGDEF domain-containing protein [Lachnospiraceae bacterium]|nr:GGDEF domain-containing protein [Lachnospiraceae bacterium]
MYKGYPVIALCIVRVEDERSFYFIQSLNERIVKAGYRLFVYQTCSDLFWKLTPEEGDKAVFTLMDYDIIDAVIVFSEIINDQKLVEEIIERTKSEGKPVFSIGKEKENAINCLFDYTDGIEKVTRHVIEKHECRDLVFVAGPKGEIHSEDRIKRFRKVIAEYDITFNDDDLYYGDYWNLPTIKVAKEMLAKKRVPDAIICANDIMAITMIQEFEKAGIKVPKDVIITGFDKTYEAVINVPTVTTSGCSLHEVSDYIIDSLKKLFNGEEVDGTFVAGFDLYEGASCGCSSEYDVTYLNEMFHDALDGKNYIYDDSKSFNEIFEVMLNLPSLNKLPEIMNHEFFTDAAVILNENFFDEKVNHTEFHSEMSLDDDVLTIFQSDYDPGDYPIKMKKRDIMPHIDEIIERENPILFASLHFYSNMIGYVCFYPVVYNSQYMKLYNYVQNLNHIFGTYCVVNNLNYTMGRIDRMARRDYLTDLYNRNGFYNCIDDVYDNGSSKYYIVASIDMDGLKKMNDRFGHEIGDIAIKTIAKSINYLKSNREQFKYNKMISGRFGGDEFVVFAAVDDPDLSEVLKKSILEFLDMYNKKLEQPYTISVSIGVCVLSSEEFDFDYALKQSDVRMYQEKKDKHKQRE